MKRLLRLYPRPWRKRYGAELEALLEQRANDLAAIADLIRGIADAHLHPELISRAGDALATAGGAPETGLVLVPGIGFRHRDALGTQANTVVERGGRVLVAAVTPDRDGVRLEFTVKGIDLDLASGWRPFDGTVRITDDGGRELAPRPRWQVGGQFTRAPDGMAMLRYVTLLGPLVPGTRGVLLEVDGSAGAWRVAIPVTPAELAGAPAYPVESSDSSHGVTIAAHAIARSAEQTAVELEAYFDPPAFEGEGPARRWISGLGDGTQLGRLGDRVFVLHGDGGAEYPEKGQPLVEPVARKHRETVFFGAIPSELAAVTLEVPHVLLQERTDDAATLAVPSDTEVSIAGCAARIAVSRVTDVSRGPRIRIHVIPTEPEAVRRLVYLQSVDTGQGPLGTIGTTVMRCAGQRPIVEVPDPSGQLGEITLRGPMLELRGPWRLRIALDHAPEARSP